ncbi:MULTISPECIES: barstar family protein [unclassified Duganella]|jgi:RNAse (barnase) inhibitor barstar|uniref:barstar family protein n=1 Tax=unclassified Duganella TaxID=2636909 RepID=UPI000881ABF1|nr:MULTISPECIES: barstar family protein [unclassified Duganella]SDG16313.1 Barstar (barnase inhibitor) [Duganella sp. OV458]SDJ31617.1 Barstar (barnase inhibitor) [Duganella sp. OV510]
MATAELNGAAIKDTDTFHAACKAAMGFPDTYGNSMDAWVDCLSYLRDDDSMSKFRLKPNEVLEIVIKDAAAMQQDILEEVTYCVAGLNERYEDYGEKPALKLTLR